MNDIVIALILGTIEGLTEFLPVSSTGHLILTSSFLNFSGEKANAFNIFIQFGAIIAVIVFFRQRLLIFLKALFKNSKKTEGLQEIDGRKFLILIILAFLPAAILGLFFEKLIDFYLFYPVPVAVALIAGGFAILIIEKLNLPIKTFEPEKIHFQQALLIGFAQCFALIPGISRSASTIMGGVMVGLSPAAAAEFSFFLAIPTLSAASLYKLAKIYSYLSAEDFLMFSVGLITSFLVAFLVIAAFMNFIRKYRFTVFALYRIVFGIFLLIIIYSGFKFNLD